MATQGTKHWKKALVLTAGLLSVAGSTGCTMQARVAGQTLPSPFYLRDDVQFFPAGPEERLPIMKAEIARYKIEQETLRGAEEQAP